MRQTIIFVCVMSLLWIVGLPSMANGLSDDGQGSYVTLTYMVDGQVFKSVSLQSGAAIDPIAAPSREGYTFSGWSKLPATMPEHDVTVNGRFFVNFYDLVFQVDGEPCVTVSVAYNVAVEAIEAPICEGYTFSGWSKLPATMPAHNVTVNGRYFVNFYDLVYQVDGVPCETVSVAFNTDVKAIEAPVREGYTFSGWKDLPAKMPACNVTVTGSFSRPSYAVNAM